MSPKMIPSSMSRCHSKLLKGFIFTHWNEDRTEPKIPRMACFGTYKARERRSKVALFQRASPALKEVLLNLHRAEKPMNIDHHLCEFGSVQYHIESSASDPQQIHLSMSIPSLSQGLVISKPGDRYIILKVKKICPGAVDILDPAKAGYQLTVEVNLAQIPQGEGGVKIITAIASIQSALLTSQLKEVICRFKPQDALQGTYRPIKIDYHPRELFFVILKQHKTNVVFPMRFREPSDVAIAASFFQELVDVGSSEALAKAPPCTWSPIPPPELRGQPAEDLSTNGGFVSFDILPHHISNKRLDKTLWNLLNFNAYVKSHVKCTRGFIQRLMRKRSDHLVKVLHGTGLEISNHIEKAPGRRWTKEFARLLRLKKLKRRYNVISRMITRFHYRIKIRGFSDFQHRWCAVPKFSCARYTKLE